MKIVFTVNTYYPLKDGVQAVTEYQAESLVKKGYDVTIITQKTGELANEEKHNGVRILRVNIQTKHSLYYGDKQAYQKLVLDETKDALFIVNVCTQTPTTDWVMPILQDIKCKKILYVHGMFDSKWYKWDFDNLSFFAHKVWNKIRWGIYYKTIKNSIIKYDHIVQLHEYDLANQYFKNKYGVNCKIIGNAADPLFFQENEVEVGMLPEKYAICIANYMDRKNQKSTLRAYYQADLPSDFGLIFIGSSLNNYCEQLIELNDELKRKYGDKNVKILYGIPREQIPTYVNKSMIYLMNSRWEAFPVSLVEAMATGTPYITTDVGCVKFLPGGIVVNSERDMAYWLTLLSNNDELSKAIGNAGKVYANKKLTQKTVTDQFERLINES